MPIRLIQPTMRFIALLFSFAVVLVLTTPASYASVTSPASLAFDGNQGCGSQMESGCPSLCQPAPAVAHQVKQITSKPLPAWSDGGIRASTPAAIPRATWPLVTTTRPGPPTYLTFRRLLL